MTDKPAVIPERLQHWVAKIETEREILTRRLALLDRDLGYLYRWARMEMGS